MSAEILNLIENVDPDDTEALDEIDAKVEMYALELDEPYERDESGRRFCLFGKEKKKLYVAEPYQYTRSRELAELHAIIQAIEWERQNND